VNKANPLRKITYQQLSDIYEGRAVTWDQVGQPGKARITVVWEHRGTKGREVFMNEIMKKWYFRDDFLIGRDCFDVAAKVAQDRNAVGFCLYQHEELEGVRPLAIAKHADGPFQEPTAENVFEGKYPLIEDLTLYLRPGASPSARAYCEFACGSESAKMAREYFLFPEHDRYAYFAEKRVAEKRTGKGVRLSAIGIVGGGKAVPDLAIEYVKAKAVVQMGYAATDSDVAAVGAFARAGSGATSKPAQAGGSAAIMAGSAIPSVGTPSSAPATMPATAPALVPPMTPFVAAGGKELLFLADKPSARAMELYGKQWNALGSTSLTTSGRDANGQPNGTGPAEYLLAGRAAAVIVNPANKIDALTIGQLQAIFGGEVADWSTIGSTGLTASGGTAKGTIKPYGLRGDDLATGIFEKECLERARWKRVEIKKDSAEVLAAVSMDPQAIGFVDLAGISATGQSVRILAIKLGTGERAKLILPTPENIKNAMYPLSQRLWLYVHPQASDTAKDFVKFIATCGASEASPYADTVKAVMDTYRKHGLVPLADAALLRMVKDAMAAAARSASSGQAVGKGKNKE
jgi:ABC-type phosphate transport system substrate-binding protein